MDFLLSAKVVNAELAAVVIDIAVKLVGGQKNESDETPSVDVRVENDLDPD
jgi:hypothetical protein